MTHNTKVVVIGAGVIGISTAYYLAKSGMQVTVLERNAHPASETSAGNAGLITPSDAYAWASTDALKTAIKSVFQADLGIKYNLRLDPRLWKWTLQFLGQCRPSRTAINSQAKYQLCHYSKQCINEVVEQTQIDYCSQKNGVVYFFRDAQSIEMYNQHFDILRNFGLELNVLNADELLHVEPALANIKHQLAGGIYCQSDQTGNSAKFCQQLAKYCADELGVEFHYNSKVTSMDIKQQKVTAVHTPERTFETHKVVVAAGSESVFICEPIGIRLPIYPVKGYSITAPLLQPKLAPKVGLIDEDRLIAVSRMGDQLRVAAKAEFSGYDYQHKESDFNTIVAAVNELFPGVADYNNATRWAGLRPMTPSSVPIISNARYENFYVNVGHGHVGWTMACGSAKLLRDLILGAKPEIDSIGYKWHA